MSTYLILSVIAFCLGVVIPELARPKLDAAKEPISTYLTGPYHLIEDAGFAALAAALILLSLVHLTGFASLFCLAAAAGIVGAMVTDTWATLVGKNARKLHLASAALAFIASFAFELASSNTIALWVVTALYPLGVGLLYWQFPKATAWQEKYAAVCIVAWLITYAVQM